MRTRFNSFFKSSIRILSLIFLVYGSLLHSNLAQAADFPDFKTPDSPQWHINPYMYDPEHAQNYSVGFENQQTQSLVQISVFTMPQKMNITIHQAVARAASIARTQGLEVQKVSELPDGTNYLQMTDAKNSTVIALVKVHKNSQASLINIFGDIRMGMAFLKSLYDCTPVMPELD